MRNQLHQQTKHRHRFDFQFCSSVEEKLLWNFGAKILAPKYRIRPQFSFSLAKVDPLFGINRYVVAK